MGALVGLLAGLGLLLIWQALSGPSSPRERTTPTLRERMAG